MPHETTIGHDGRQLVMRRSGVQIPEGAPRKHVASKRVLGDPTATADRLEADLPQIDFGREPVLRPRRPFRPPPARSSTRLVRLLTCLATSPACPDASLLCLGQESRRDWTRPEKRAALRGRRRGCRSCPVDSSPFRLRNPVRASRSFLEGIQPRQSVHRRDLSIGESHQSIRECRRPGCDTCDESRIRRRHLPGEAVAPFP